MKTDAFTIKRFTTIIAILFLALVAGSCGNNGDKEEVVLAGLTLNKSDEKTFQNKKLLVTGDININDDARLTILDCEIFIDQEYHQQYTLEVKGNAHLRVEDSDLSTRDWTWHNWNYIDNSEIYLKNFTWTILWQGIDGSHGVSFASENTAIGLTASPGPTQNKISISTSPAVHLELAFDPGTYDFTLPAPGSYVDLWTAPYYPLLEVANSTIKQIDIDVTPDVNLIVRDTKDLNFGWAMGFTGNVGHYTIDGIKVMHYDDQTFAADDASLRLINTNVENWWPTTFGSIQLTVRDTVMADPRTWENSRMIIEDSQLYLFAANDNSKTEIHRSTIENNIHAAGEARVDLYDMTYSENYTGHTVTENGVIYEDGEQVAP